MSEFEDIFEDIVNDMCEVRFGLTDTLRKFKNVQKSCVKEIEKQRMKVVHLKKKNGGFNKPMYISNQLCEFLKIPKGSLLTRAEVTKSIDFYIKEHDLLHEMDKRIILPDKRLGYLLGCKKNDDVTYFNLQKWLKPHYIQPYNDGEGQLME